MKKRRIAALYRENCGGVLRNSASGLLKAASNIAEVELYDDLRERIFRNDASNHAEGEEKASA